ncbi:hypothetical protein CB1_000413023 [Camelus ferus]|nr:hypothetical protein CB1_000413023 [Camelus ferus]
MWLVGPVLVQSSVFQGLSALFCRRGPPVGPAAVTVASARCPHSLFPYLGHPLGVSAPGAWHAQTTSSTLKGAIQLGIGYTVGNLSSKPERDVLMQDFYVVESIFFPSEGSNLTPAHHFQDFRFKTYAPVAFRYFRELFGIRPDDYLYSLCNEPLIELSNPGASGSLFYVTSDDEFIIKTVMHKEAEFLQKLLPGYYMNLNQNPRTLLPKFYGLYCVQSGGKNIRVVVMNNVLPRVVKMHLKFDLKGSTYKRRASRKEKEKSLPTYKDLDFIQDVPEGLLLDADTFSALVKTLQRDCLGPSLKVRVRSRPVLESFKIMDYSLLLGVHNIDQQERERQAEGAQSTADEKRPLGQKALYSTAMESIQGGAARGEAIETDDTMGGIPAVNGRGERLLLHIGIIDILQSYRFIKKLEHTWKALVHDGDTVSVHRPSFYAERFFKFMSNTVFRKNSSLKSSPSKKGRGALLAVKPLGPTAAFSASQIPSEREEAQYDLRGARSYPTLEDEGRPDLLPCTPPSFEEATTASIATTLSSTSLSIPERSPSETSEQPRYREGASPACASAAAVEAETASQASEPASQASDEEDAPSTDIYFPDCPPDSCGLILSPHPVLCLLPPPPSRPAQFTDGRYWIYSPRHRRLRAVTLSSSGTERKQQEELMKAFETPEEKRARRLAKKEAKERKKREKMGWGEEYMGYTNTDNPFGDNNLLGTFIWNKMLCLVGLRLRDRGPGEGDGGGVSLLSGLWLPFQALEKKGISHLEEKELKERNKRIQEDNRLELQKVKQLRLEREREKAMREQELEMLQREKEAEHFKTWEEQEDNFHLQQAKLRGGGGRGPTPQPPPGPQGTEPRACSPSCPLAPSAPSSIHHVLAGALASLGIVTRDASESAEDIFFRRAKEGMGQDEAQFSVEMPLTGKAYLWADKYRPRKPRFFNRVHTGFEWNKYNQTHYDFDNPPPKIVQGYKFNIFYPDLIDKRSTPEYFLEACPDNKDFATLRFHAGPPYEDIAFKIVNREWEYSHRHGFRCQFANGIFQLWFHFKRYRYRR